MLVNRTRTAAAAVAAGVVALGVAVPVALSTRDDAATSSASGGVTSGARAAAQGTPNGSSRVTVGGSAASEGGPRTKAPRETAPGEAPRPGARHETVGLTTQATRLQVGRGRVVAGFPRAVRVLPGSRVTSSSVSPAGRRAQVALTATTGDSPTAVVDHFRSTLRAAGMRDDVADALPGSRAVRFSRGSEVLVLTVRPRGAGSAYSLVGVLPVRGSRS